MENINYDLIRRLNPSLVLDLDLERCGIVCFACGFFANFPHLKRINLRGNRIASLARETFETPAKIERLDLSGNRLRELDAVVFAKLAFLRVLILSRNRIERLTNECLCSNSVRTLDLAGNEIREVSRTALHGLPHLICLNLSSNRIQRLDRTVFDPCPELEHLSVHDNEIDCLPNLSGLLHLKILHMKRNRVRTLNELDFRNNHHLKFIDLSSNRLHEMPRAVFVNKPYLRTVKLTLHDKFQPYFLLVLDQLETLHLDLPTEPLEQHKSEILQLIVRLRNLKNLTIVGAMFVYDHCAELKNLQHLRYLHFEGYDQRTPLETHRLRGIALHTEFLSFRDLRTIVLKRCYLQIAKSIRDPNSGQWCFSALDLTGLRNDTLLNPFDGFVQLQHLNLSCSAVRKMNVKIFRKLVNLRYLNLERVCLQYVIRGWFVSNRRLETLILKECSIQCIESGSFRNLRMLRVLDLTANSPLLKTNRRTFIGLDANCVISR